MTKKQGSLWRVMEHEAPIIKHAQSTEGRHKLRNEMCKLEYCMSKLWHIMQTLLCML